MKHLIDVLRTPFAWVCVQRNGDLVLYEQNAITGRRRIRVTSGYAVAPVDWKWLEAK